MEDRLWHKAYNPEVPPSLDYEKLTMPEALERTARDLPDQVALIMMGKEIRYRELDILVNRFALALAELGICKGDKVALLLPNIPQVVIAAYKVPKLVEFMEELPKSAIGKVLRRKLKEMDMERAKKL